MKRILLMPSTIFWSSQSFTALRRENHLRTASPPIKTDVPPELVIEWQDRNSLCNVLNKTVFLSVSIGATYHQCINRHFTNFMPASINADPI
ncbi:hypothetical protein CEXT_449301 [Caerostris extrusa]|uniref:Secreted protein n=1 Tax=Caerostris extrusa TaxID=172846 RepID=A0AAV4UWP3_CAEEX|nr:hypothetical protein CEXT_449301 [Caerostris extrusa]